MAFAVCESILRILIHWRCWWYWAPPGPSHHHLDYRDLATSPCVVSVQRMTFLQKIGATCYQRGRCSKAFFLEVTPFLRSQAPWESDRLQLDGSTVWSLCSGRAVEVTVDQTIDQLSCSVNALSDSRQETVVCQGYCGCISVQIMPTPEGVDEAEKKPVEG